MRTILLANMGLIACGDDIRVLETETITLSCYEGIVSLEDSLVRPVLYRNIPNLSQLPVNESKEKFIAAVLPAILIAKHYLSVDKEKIKAILEKDNWDAKDSIFYNTQLERFQASDVESLLIKIETHPNSIVLAQAATESGWGSSRFFRKANNLFGIWAYNANEPRIQAGEADVYLRKYDDIDQSILDYFETLGRARAYSKFREVRAESDDIDRLLPHLRNYSERGTSYTKQLKTIIDQNNLTQYDNYKLDPCYFIEK